jgi:hypothetical protein
MQEESTEGRDAYCMKSNDREKSCSWTGRERERGRRSSARERERELSIYTVGLRPIGLVPTYSHLDHGMPE